ncbi:MAG: glucosamine-6-phosphate deaminase [Candidatus Marinimicrobia bacterium]|jgi:glucosamine-6-phosphate deaminase|nr:glucosamine-6-phosphate deaminase [Candidatus Neomarinimicrobiota bacterium]MCK9483321.1 glucosamine-6-phosphate deaminase [Candidatus Neomarinimicrobiota bacterium]MCK9560048.1 glucosamine-6-phosphate deaminase [Candidatus Neomarinimicrobiota bacterium]MDD5231683.1 glucosamine-6-phosphate deaminase [Candidatus Neomarinimicrobiota bacterium]MDD5539905.1 glucosamine-6-phosphate deaminase [Candidatus Neomarinimicrobiota bacterium]
MRIIIHEDYDKLSNWVAHYIAAKINHAKQTTEKPFILGLPTGSSPIGTYQALVRLYKEKKVSFKNVITFNMDEYVGLPENHPESYHYFMHHYLFDHIDIPRENINILNGNAKDLDAECADYEAKIKTVGGFDLFLGGIGVNGHLAFNEPGSSITSRTRVKTLAYETIIANSRFFDNNISRVPKTALTVGVGTVMEAREILIIINSYRKARALQKVVEESVNHMWTVSMLQLHPHGTIVCDDEATLDLKVSTVKYFKEMEHEAINNLPM